jgi:hypothetical protein
MTYPFNRPNDTSTGGAGGGGCGGYSGGNGRVQIPIPPRNRPFPWPFPASATQGAIGGAGGVGLVSRQKPPYYGPFQPYWPYAVPDQYYRGLPTPSLRF